jgi:hypothetical protein
MNICLFLSSLFFGFVGFPKWFQEEEDNRKLRKKVRECNIQKKDNELKKLRKES